MGILRNILNSWRPATTQPRSTRPGSGLAEIAPHQQATPEAQSRYADIPNITVPLDHTRRLPQITTALRHALAPDTAPLDRGRAIAHIMTAAQTELARGIAINDLGNPTAAHVALALVAQLDSNPVVAPTLYQALSQWAAHDSAAGHATRIALGAAICYGTPGAAAAHVILQPLCEHETAVGQHARALRTRTGSEQRIPPATSPAYTDWVAQQHQRFVAGHNNAALQALLNAGVAESAQAGCAAHLALVDIVARTNDPAVIDSICNYARYSDAPGDSRFVVGVLRDARAELLHYRTEWSRVRSLERDTNSPAGHAAHAAALATMQ